ncbi:MAG: hypothetical protein IAF38_16160, partial [Bacteroidia bacterium]|nr:hypothetical protein [Bacteroidia bacterium]
MNFFFYKDISATSSFGKKILLLFSFFCFLVNAQEIKFKSIGVDEGLSINFVQCILQDKNGFMWFGTQDGLNRYDGYQVSVYRNKNDDQNSISNNSINCLFEDKNGNIVIGTNDGGLDIFNPQNNSFRHFDHNPKKKSLSNNTVKCITQDKQGLIWAGTEHGLNSINSVTGEVTNYFHEDSNPFSLPDNRVFSLSQTENGTIWIGTFNKGLCNLDPVSGKFKSFPVPEKFTVDHNSSLNEYRHRIYSLYIVENSTIYVGTDGGLGVFNSQTQTWENFVLFGDPNAENVTLLNRIWGIDEDSQGALWIASYGGGLIRYQKNGG